MSTALPDIDRRTDHGWHRALREEVAALNATLAHEHLVPWTPG